MPSMEMLDFDNIGNMELLAVYHGMKSYEITNDSSHTKQRDPSVKNYRDKTIPHYRDLDILVGKDYATGAKAGTGNIETNIPQEGFEVDNEEVESVYSTIDERTPNRASSTTTLAGASAPSTGASAPKKIEFVMTVWIEMTEL
ncbi:hypothetical protein GIB67_019163 [Kingdonia uniflora]|uniref:Uncharacterized protein n=1 Tax=Kingdonia uniflora TaxID=39325 RepID=A0A7J7N015_9MAGN|nr:hypothetical protein GIB67_019163 [Kingdonia uniflora]